jgi:3-oxoacyl-[acyl-carrier-protein] synthase III
MIRSVIVGTGSYIPEVVVSNEAFQNHQFLEVDGSNFKQNNKYIIDKFEEITGIRERRYSRNEQTASDLAYHAAIDALESSSIDKESLDYIIVAHNFGDVALNSNRSSLVPSLASRVKMLLKIKNPDCVAYDVAFGCPGWLEGLIQANYFISSGDAKRCMVIGTETLSRVIDPHDRDSMIYGDGSGCVIVEGSDSEKGILSHKTRTFAIEHSGLLKMDHSNAKLNGEQRDSFLKMNGRKVYEFALTNVPEVIKFAIDKSGCTLNDISKVLVHQANNKMDEAIVQRLFKSYHVEHIPVDIMPMTIGWLGNSSVATIPTLIDLILKGKLAGHSINEGEKVVMASVGAGMNVNAIVYQF